MNMSNIPENNNLPTQFYGDIPQNIRNIIETQDPLPNDNDKNEIAVVWNRFYQNTPQNRPDLLATNFFAYLDRIGMMMPEGGRRKRKSSKKRKSLKKKSLKKKKSVKRRK